MLDTELRVRHYDMVTFIASATRRVGDERGYRRPATLVSELIGPRSPALGSTTKAIGMFGVGSLSENDLHFFGSPRSSNATLGIGGRRLGVSS
jgi:hypothetical protein